MNTSLNAWKVAAGFEGVVAEPDAPQITFADRGAEGNRAQRRELVEVLSGSLPSISSEFFDHLISELGLDGDVIEAAKPLEARQVRQIIDETERHVVSERAKSVAEGVAVAERLLQESFETGTQLVIDDIFTELAKIIPPTNADVARQVALEVVREETERHLKDVREIVHKTFREMLRETVTEQVKDKAVEEFRAYSKACLEQYRVSVADVEHPVSFSPTVVKARAFFVVLSSAVKIVESAVRLRAALVVIRVKAEVAARKAALEALKERLKSLNEQLEALTQALLARLEEKEDESEDKADIDALIRRMECELQTVLTDESNEEIVRLVAGFDQRIADRRADVREAVTGHKITGSAADRTLR